VLAAAPVTVTGQAKNKWHNQAHGVIDVRHRVSDKLKNCYISNMVYNHMGCEKIAFYVDGSEYAYYWHCQCCGAKFLPNGDVIDVSL